MSTPQPVPQTPPAPPRPLRTPDITPAQIVAIGGAAIGLAVAFGVPISHDKQVALTNFVTIFAPVLIAIDAVIRGARAKWVHGPAVAAQAAHLALLAAQAAPQLEAALAQPGAAGESSSSGLPAYL